MSNRLYKKQGPMTVARDPETGRLAKDAEGKVIKAVTPHKKDKRPETWRRFLMRLTNDGHDLVMNHLNLATGNPIIPILPDGRTGEPIIPSAEVRRAANMDLMQMGFGKAVDQTAVSQAEDSETERMRLQAMSDEQLDKLIEGELVSVAELGEGGEE